MKANRAKDTSPELELRGALWRLGLRYRLRPRDLPGRPDLVFRQKKVAVFCDGDFWHGRNWATQRQKLLKGANAEYWVAKIAYNRRRDKDHVRELQARGWIVVRLWETEIRGSPERAARKVLAALGERRG
jgi:DNA mismatch endonuclease (patch repair protein)